MAPNTGSRGIGLVPAMLLASATALAALLAIWFQLSAYVGAH